MQTLTNTQAFVAFDDDEGADVAVFHGANGLKIVIIVVAIVNIIIAFIIISISIITSIFSIILTTIRC